MISIFAAILIYLSLFFETIGFNFRRIGKLSGKASLGYSLHVQFATVSRFGIFIGFPLIGLLIDQSTNIHQIILVPIIAYSLIFLSLLFCIFNLKKIDYLFKRFFHFQLRLSGLDSVTINDGTLFKDQSFSKKRVIVLGFISFLFASSGIFFVSILSFIFSDYKATILLSSPAVTAFGTLISVMFFDPFISRQIDDIDEPITVIKYIYLSRAVSSCILFFIFLILFFNA